MTEEKLYYTKVVSENGNEYVRLNDSHTIFTSEILKSPKRIKYLEKLNLLKESRFFEDEKIDEEIIRRKIYESALQQLTLEVTTACNFRCKYCVFGGNYKLMRSHETKNMDWTTAKKAIDLYFKLFSEAEEYNYTRKPMVTFYGGEPLINFTLIKDCILYIEQQYTNYDVHYSLTTNGTLLTDEVIDFLYLHNVNAVVSLDGPKEEHNRNRVYSNGKGTFDDVYINIIKLSKKFRRPVFTICVYDIRSDIEKISTFYDNTSAVICLNTTPVKSFGSDYYTQFTEKEKIDFNEKEKKMKYYFMNNIAGDNSKVLNFLDRYFIDRCATFFCSFVDTHSVNGKITKCTNPCIPGQKIFVSVEGRIYVCEKVSQSYSIGNVEEGLNYKKIVNLVKQYCESIVGCKVCEIRNECGVCNMIIENDNGFNVDKAVCESIYNTRKKQFKLALDICEKDPIWTKMAIALYYKSMEEEVKNLL
ncbi:radical SAM protein [Candidatus Galacturonibacter soehngenii]|nr:radical SAM protein [Candidatus Galacturonibacter soehngenii]